MAGYSLPEGFLRVMENDLKTEFDEKTRGMQEKICEMQDRVQKETDEKKETMRRDFHREAERLKTRRDRALRSLNSETSKKLATLRLARLEEAVMSELENFRKCENYGDFLAGMYDRCCDAGFCGKGIIQAEDPEATLFEKRIAEGRISGCRVTRKNLSRWGGFILIEEGGALFDCTFKTRWRQYRRELPLAPKRDTK